MKKTLTAKLNDEVRHLKMVIKDQEEIIANVRSDFHNIRHLWLAGKARILVLENQVKAMDQRMTLVKGIVNL